MKKLIELFISDHTTNGDSMVTRYEIRREQDREVLILYLDYREEISQEWWNAIKEHSVVKQVASYIKNHQIKWDGNKIILVSSGIVLATLLAFAPVKNFEAIQDPTSSFVYVGQEVKPELFLVQEQEDSIGLDSVIDDSIQEVDSDTSTNSSTKPNASPSKGTSSSNSSSSIGNNSSNSQGNGNSGSGNQSTSKPEVTGPMVTVYRSNGSVLTLGLEEYLVGVVAAEMPASFHKEALKAQAVVARTYALRSIQEGKKLTDTQDTQVYKDQNQLKQEWGASFSTYYQKVQAAVQETKGRYLTYQGRYIEALYFSTSNGYTEDASYVWGNSVPYLQSVVSSWDTESRFFHQEVYKDKQQVFSSFGLDANIDGTIQILERNRSGRVVSLKLGSTVISGVTFRSRLGLASTDFEIQEVGSQLKIVTKGWGHGVGMSQYGANGMAKNGYTYNQILTHYYQGVTLQGS